MKKNIYFFNIAAAFILTAVMIIGCKPSTESPKPTPESCKITFSVDGEHGTLKAQVKDGNAINSGALIEKGKMIDFTAEPDTGYAVERWMLNGAAVNGTAVRYSLKVTQNATVKVIFKKKETPPSPLYTPIQYAQLKNYLENTANKPAADGVYYIEVTELTNENLEGSWEPNSLGKILKDCDKKVALKLSGTITAFSKGTFSGCTELTSVTIPDGVIGIGESVFEGCTKLTEVKLPAKLTKIGSNTFSGCSSLTSITIPKNVTKIAGSAFSGCTKLENITIPAGVTEIGWGAFKDCKKLTEIHLPARLNEIGGNPFSGCINHTKLTVEVGNLKYKSENNMIYTLNMQTLVCAAGGLTSISIPNSVTAIGAGAFSGYTGLTSITIPKDVTAIGYSAFSGCTKLESITIPKSLTSIDVYTFENCSALTQVEFPENAALITIDKGAFGGCTSLTSITIPNNVTTIHDIAFFGCTAAEITLPESITTIGGNAFGSDTSSCKKVRIKDGANHDRIEKLVKDSGYPADRIEKY